jgi:hypothetical protein
MRVVIPKVIPKSVVEWKAGFVAFHVFLTLSTGMVRRLFHNRIILAGRRLTMEISTIGIDLGKTTFHAIGLNARGEIVLRKKSLLHRNDEQTRTSMF